VLLDTHVLLWWASGDPRLGPRARRVLTSAAQRPVLSAISVWEISIKEALGRLRVLDHLEELTAGLDGLPFRSEHARATGTLPPLHRDPFDRALVASAQVEGLRLVTADPSVLAYDVDTLDARR